MVITKKSSTLDKIIDELKDWNDTHEPFDVMTKMGSVEFDVGTDRDGILRQANGQEKMPQEVFLSRHATSQFLARLQYPRKLYERLSNKLNIQNLNYLMQTHAYKYPIILRIIDGNKARALVSERYEPFDDLELMTILEPYLKYNSVRWYYKDEMTLHLSMSFKNGRKLKAGGIVKPGIHISNSEVGVRSVTIIGYVYRLICKNGLISTMSDIYRFRHVGDPAELQQNVLDAVMSARLGATKIFNALNTAVDKKIDKPEDFLQKVRRNRKLKKEQAEVVLKTLFKDKKNQTNLFGMSQALSQAANRFEGEAAYNLRQAAAYVLGMKVRGDGGEPS